MAASAQPQAKEWPKLSVCNSCSKPFTSSKRIKRTSNYCDCSISVDCRGCHTRTTLGSLRCLECHDQHASQLKRKLPLLERKLEFLRKWHHPNTQDVEIKTADDHTFHANRLILVSKSPVFKAMLEDDMQETRRRCIHLEDVNHEVFGVFLDYLHTAEVSLTDMQKHHASLFTLSNKYDVGLLRNECEEYMLKYITTDNVLKVLLVAWRCGADSLKVEAMSVLKNTYKKVLGSPEYNELAEEDPALMNQILKAILLCV